MNVIEGDDKAETPTLHSTESDRWDLREQQILKETSTKFVQKLRELNKGKHM